jgi:hypothetical protein
MSRVATASRQESLGIPASVETYWGFSYIKDSSLTGKLQGFRITSQQQVPALTSFNKLYGEVDTVGEKTALSLLNGFTTTEEQNGQQKVSFKILLGGSLYHFSGVLSADGSQITDGFVEKHLDPEIEPDGSWSATAVPGPTTEKPGKVKDKRKKHRGSHRR